MTRWLIASASVGGAARALPFLTRIGPASPGTGSGSGTNGAGPSKSASGTTSSTSASSGSNSSSKTMREVVLRWIRLLDRPPRSAAPASGSSGSQVSSGMAMIGGSSESVSQIARITSIGSGSRPGPNSPQAIGPSSGSITAIPRSRSAVILAWVAGFSHIRTFIAGIAMTGLSVASSSVVARSSAIPWVILASRSAVAGQTTIRSA